MHRTLVAMAVAALACGPRPPPSAVLAGPKLPEPPPGDSKARGAAYLGSLAALIQPQWGQFLEDCRLRLARTHPLNQPSLVVVAELAIGRDGKVVPRIATGSGNGDFDTAVFDLLGDISPVPAPPPGLVSDDELSHVRWLFARDARQAGPATAQVFDVHLPLVAVVDRLIADKALTRAITRVRQSAAEPDFLAASEHIMIATLRDSLYSSDGPARRAAVEAVARAQLGELGHDVHLLAAPIADRDLRIAAIAAAAQLRDQTVVPMFASTLADDLVNQPRVALAEVEAMAMLGHGELARPAIRAELAKGPSATALAALALVPDKDLTSKLTGWLASSDAGIRASVCAALPGAAGEVTTLAATLIGRGMRDADATVRARCIDAVGRLQLPAAASALLRLHQLALDRDRTVRSHAIAALGRLEPDHKLRAIADPVAEIRAASAIGAREADLRALATDKDPDVRAAALTGLGDKARDLAGAATADLSATVRRVAINTLDDDAALTRLANDDSPDVATAALVRLVARRGRAAIAETLLANLAATPPPPARVRIALAWLLAR